MGEVENCEVCCLFLSRRATEGGLGLIGARVVWSMGRTASVNVRVVLGLKIAPKGGG